MKTAMLSFLLLLSLVFHAASDEISNGPVAENVTCETLYRLKACEDSICTNQCSFAYGDELVKHECLDSYDCNCHYIC
ncbi:hypothetical protein H6P81_006139 [Aristolochia fimbriata]|uniref:Uncharacterized protein n=1 Tax=Aristolochia fimbriata TaxID=158543 RepID=A0AAV7EYN0_ARIFI|nr:hypothetical protein H6P81_006139 [Aristolochia fimbriata]